MITELVLRIGKNGATFHRILTKEFDIDMQISRDDRFDVGVVVDVIIYTQPELKKVILINYKPLYSAQPYDANKVADALILKAGWKEYK